MTGEGLTRGDARLPVALSDLGVAKGLPAGAVGFDVQQPGTFGRVLVVEEQLRGGLRGKLAGFLDRRTAARHLRGGQLLLRLHLRLQTGNRLDDLRTQRRRRVRRQLGSFGPYGDGRGRPGGPGSRDVDGVGSPGECRRRTALLADRSRQRLDVAFQVGDALRPGRPPVRRRLRPRALPGAGQELVRRVVGVQTPVTLLVAEE